ncbi:holin family protein [Pseudooceanicola sp. LIPI14-2-Ac024]|uniref:holin family protein n=1 Tax=Pseudooceanicola sp. LIPI14-2-Ac024 TaxID=3344875 RepID=UPI0035D0A7CE
MGLIDTLFGALFGRGRNVVRETAEVFRENAEAGARRDHDLQSAALEQFAAEFAARRSWFDALIDGLNRLPRPLLALGTIGLMAAAMVDPDWFSARMVGLSLVPEALWWLMGAIVSFYFGARHQAKGQQFQRDIAATMARAPQVIEGLATRAAAADSVPQPAPAAVADTDTEANAALDEWRRLGQER